MGKEIIPEKNKVETKNQATVKEIREAVEWKRKAIEEKRKWLKEQLSILDKQEAELKTIIDQMDTELSDIKLKIPLSLSLLRDKTGANTPKETGETRI